MQHKFAKLESLRKQLDAVRNDKEIKGSKTRERLMDFLREEIDIELTRLQRKCDAGVIDMDTPEYGEEEC